MPDRPLLPDDYTALLRQQIEDQSRRWSRFNDVAWTRAAVKRRRWPRLRWKVRHLRERLALKLAPWLVLP